MTSFVFTATGCPHCKRLTRAITKANALAGPGDRIAEVDMHMHHMSHIPRRILGDDEFPMILSFKNTPTRMFNSTTLRPRLRAAIFGSSDEYSNEILLKKIFGGT